MGVDLRQDIQINSSVIRPKGESQSGGNKKAKHAKFLEKRKWYANVSARIRG